MITQTPISSINHSHTEQPSSLQMAQETLVKTVSYFAEFLVLGKLSKSNLSNEEVHSLFQMANEAPTKTAKQLFLEKRPCSFLDKVQFSAFYALGGETLIRKTIEGLFSKGIDEIQRVLQGILQNPQKIEEFFPLAQQFLVASRNQDTLANWTQGNSSEAKEVIFYRACQKIVDSLPQISYFKSTHHLAILSNFLLNGILRFFILRSLYKTIHEEISLLQETSQTGHHSIHNAIFKGISNAFTLLKKELEKPTPPKTAIEIPSDLRGLIKELIDTLETTAPSGSDPSLFRTLLKEQVINTAAEKIARALAELQTLSLDQLLPSILTEVSESIQTPTATTPEMIEENFHKAQEEGAKIAHFLARHTIQTQIPDALQSTSVRVAATGVAAAGALTLLGPGILACGAAYAGYTAIQAVRSKSTMSGWGKTVLAVGAAATAFFAPVIAIPMAMAGGAHATETAKQTTESELGEVLTPLFAQGPAFIAQTGVIGALAERALREFVAIA